MAVNGGNSDPPENSAEGEEDEEPCPLCGEDMKRLPNHLPVCPEGG